MNNRIKTIFLGGLTVLAALGWSLGDVNAVIAAVMSSTNYSLQSDSVNFGGGQSNSASYRMEDTLGETATGESESANYKIKAGYQQMNAVYLAMTAATDVVMDTSLGGITGGMSNGSTATTVTTDGAAGYELYIKASSSPAMRGNTQGDTIANYTPADTGDPPAPDFTFSVPATAAEFGFTPEGTDIATEYLDNGSICGVGALDTSKSCWNAVTTTNELIARRTSGNHPNGVETTVNFRIIIGSSSFKIEDTYTATTTLTAVSL